MAAGTGSRKPVDHSTTLAERFNAFWAAYPKKIGKGAAEKAWMKIKPNEVLFTAILSALSEQTKSEQWKRDNGQYIPNPLTWLTQKRWEDDIPITPAGGNKSNVYTKDSDGTMRDSFGNIVF
jgi:hypothetical protein